MKKSHLTSTFSLVFEAFKYTIFMIKFQSKTYWKSIKFCLVFQDVITAIFKIPLKILILTTRPSDKCPNKKGFTKQEANPHKSKLMFILFLQLSFKIAFFHIYPLESQIVLHISNNCHGFCCSRGRQEDALYVPFITLSIY